MVGSLNPIGSNHRFSFELHGAVEILAAKVSQIVEVEHKKAPISQESGCS
jgi:hypothetical protein